MLNTILKQPSLIDNLWQSENTLFRNAILCIVGTILLAVSAQVKVPIGPVPISMQSFVVLLIGVSYGMSLGGFTVLLYLMYGIAGLPVFAGGIGAAVLLGPSGGYLIGFWLAAMVAGYLAQNGFTQNFPRMMALGIIASAAIYVTGLLQLGAVIGWDKPILQIGLLPFIYGDCLKIILVAALMRGFLSRINHKES
ncbi:MAG: biotin transporter BioY [Alphaproteobacteria bacterium]|nr:biotin transporter BioY [Alphaproteobacteria bacterium]